MFGALCFTNTISSLFLQDMIRLLRKDKRMGWPSKLIKAKYSYGWPELAPDKKTACNLVSQHQTT